MLTLGIAIALYLGLRLPFPTRKAERKSTNIYSTNEKQTVFCMNAHVQKLVLELV